MKSLFGFFIAFWGPVGALVFSTLPALKMLGALVFLYGHGVNQEWLQTRHNWTNEVSDLKESEDLQRSLKRDIQTYFRKYDIYIPLDSIYIPHPAQKSREEKILFQLMRKFCGQGTIYIWIPFRIDAPFIGRKTFESCLHI